MLMECLGSVVSVGVRTARFPRPICRRPRLTQSLLVDQPFFATSEMGDSMDADFVNNELVLATSEDRMLQTVRSWVESGDAASWTACAGLAPELRCWRLQIGNLKVDSLGRLWRRRSPPSAGSQLVVPVQKRQDLIKQFHDSIFAGHLGITRTVFRLLDRPT